MARTNQQIDNLNIMLKAEGKDPLPYETEDNGGDGGAQETEAEKLAREQKEKDDAAPLEDKGADSKIETPAAAEITDEAVLRFLESKGIKVESIEGLKHTPTPEEIAKQKEQRANEVVAYGLQKGLFTTKEYEQYVSDTNDRQDVVFQNYLSEALESDKDLTEAEIREEFNSKYGLDAEPGSRKYNRGQKEIDVVADKIIRSRHEKVLGIESVYSTFENEQRSITDTERKVVAALPVYTSDVKSAISSLNKIPFKLSDTETYDVPVSEEAILKIETALLDPKYSRDKILKGYSKEEITAIAKGQLILTNIDSFVSYVATQHALKKQAGSKGVPQLEGKQRKDEQNEIILTENQKAALKLIDANHPLIAN